MQHPPMAEVKHSTAEEALARLRKEKEAYESEIASLRQALVSEGETADRYRRKLLEDQISETCRALEMVDGQMQRFSCSSGEK